MLPLDARLLGLPVDRPARPLDAGAHAQGTQHLRTGDGEAAAPAKRAELLVGLDVHEVGHQPEGIAGLAGAGSGRPDARRGHHRRQARAEAQHGRLRSLQNQPLAAAQVVDPLVGRRGLEVGPVEAGRNVGHRAIEAAADLRGDETLARRPLAPDGPEAGRPGSIGLVTLGARATPAGLSPPGPVPSARSYTSGMRRKVSGAPGSPDASTARGP